MAEREPDSTMTAVERRFRASGMSLQALGLKMGYPEAFARKSAWQFMRTGDPRIGMLRRFADAMGIKVTTLIREADNGEQA